MRRGGWLLRRKVLRKGRILRGMVAGAIGGLAASWVMNQFQEGATYAESKILDIEPPKQRGDDATVKTAHAISKRVRGRRVAKREKKNAGRGSALRIRRAVWRRVRSDGGDGAGFKGGIWCGVRKRGVAARG